MAMTQIVMAVMAALLLAPGPLGLPDSAELKTKAGLDDAQVTKVDAVYAEYKDKAEAAKKKADAATDPAEKKAARQEVGTLRAEIAGKLKEIGKDPDQQKKIGEATAPPAKKKKTP